ncbi:MAG: xylose isomerase [Acidobacteria bacterium]|nr:xylose isomerase [Acidobacteriota bacterium]|tara:strand:+ start:7136 stop:8305 length:1170 start_codon:yes stop_codon:yes gene_type:complete
MSTDPFLPAPEHKFSFGLWTVGNPGRDPFGEPVRDRLSPVQLVELLGEVGAWGVNLHDNDLVPIDANASVRDGIVREFRTACVSNGLTVPMVTTNLFTDPAFKDGAFTANDQAVRALSVQKAMGAMDLGAELGAKIFVMWGGREGAETDGCRRPDVAIARLREAVNFLCEYSVANGYDYRIALEAKPNEPRSDIYMPTTGAYLGFIATLDHPELVGVNPEVAHEHMAGLNMTHSVAQAWDAGKLFHIDLNDQLVGRFDQDFRFGAANPKAAFWLVKFLEEVGYDGPRHFDAHAYRTEGYEGVKDFARGCMRTYLILKDKARRWRADPEISALVAGLAESSQAAPPVGRYSQGGAESLKLCRLDRAALGGRELRYEQLDQLTIEILCGVR